MTHNAKRDTAASTARATRRSFLRGSLATSAGLLAAQAVTWPASASAQGVGGQQTRQNFRDIQRHENFHVQFLRGALGGAARPEPTFQNLLQPSVREFFQVSQDLENTGVGAYLGAAPVIFDRGVLAAAGSIALIEGRHAGWVNTLVNDPITLNVFNQEQNLERALTIAEVVDRAGPFIASLNGGPELTFSLTPSAANDVSILNFALALEFLEAEFYNRNVPEFFGQGK